MDSTNGNDRPRAVILGGTRGLGHAIALELLGRGVCPLVVGRSAGDAISDPALRGAEFLTADVTRMDAAGKVARAAFTDSRRLPSAFYWVTGNYHRGSFAEQTIEKMVDMFETHLIGPMSVLREFQRAAVAAKSPYHLVVIGSVFVHKPGKKHAVLSTVKAAKANFCRVFVHELAANLPGSGILLVNPWAIKGTNFFDGYTMDPKMVDSFMDPREVAKIICDEENALSTSAQRPLMVELTLDRGEGGTIKQLYGPQHVTY